MPINSIRAKTTLAMTLVGLLPVLLLIAISATRMAENLRKEHDTRHQAVTRGISRHLTSELVNAKGDLASLSSNPILTAKGSSHSALQTEIQRLNREVFTNISLLDDQGFVLQSSLAINQLQEYSPWFRHTLADRVPTISSPFLATGVEGLQVAIFLPTRQTKGSKVSVIRATISFDRIVKVLDPVVIGEQGKLALLDQSGNVLFSSGQRALLEKYDASLPRSYWSDTAAGEYSDPAQGRFNFVSQSVSLPDQIGSHKAWTLVWFEHASVIDTAINEVYVSHGIVAIFALTLATGVGLFVSRRLTSPISQLQNFSEQIAQGNLEAQLSVGTSNELGKLAETMVQMGQEIKASREQLEDSLLERAKHREDEILVREIHHRVKNNLQIITSLFRMNLRRVKGDEAKQVLVESESRLRSMSLLHEAMHRSGDISEIEAGSYLRAVADYSIQRHRHATGELVELELSATDLDIGIDTALPCGLVVNEVVDRLLRKSSHPSSPKRILLGVQTSPSGATLSLTLQGVVHDPSEEVEFLSSLSFKLVDLMADQLGGRIEWLSGAGQITAQLSFDETVYTDRVGLPEPASSMALPA